MMLEGFQESLGGEQAAVLGEGDEEHPVEELLGIKEEDLGGHGRVGRAEPAEDVPPDSGVFGVVAPGELDARLLGRLEELVQMARARRRCDAVRAEEENELAERGLVPGQGLDVEALEGPLVVILVVEADLAEVGDQDPVAREIDGVAVGLVDGGHPPARERSIERIARSLSFQCDQEAVAVAAELSDHGVRELAVHFHALFPREGVALAGRGRATVAEDPIEEVGEIVGKELGLVQLFRPGGLQQARPFPQDLPRRLGLGPHGQRCGAWGEDLGAEEGFAFDRHGPEVYCIR
ncbi:MAG TPA: hypothetical protein VGG20_02625 [Thermoanaerobaculia bacterium]